MILPVDRISIIRLENILGHDIISWPRREADRETQNALSAALGGEYEHEFHGRSIKGAGEPVEAFRNMIIPGRIIAHLISQLQDAWLVELVKVQEEADSVESKVPKTKLQLKWLTPNADMSGELSIERNIEFLGCLRQQNLSVRGFFLNHYDRGDFVQLILGPALNGGRMVDWNFSRGPSYLFIDF